MIPQLGSAKLAYLFFFCCLTIFYLASETSSLFRLAEDLVSQQMLLTIASWSLSFLKEPTAPGSLFLPFYGQWLLLLTQNHGLKIDL